jgi:hypothetical protein
MVEGSGAEPSVIDHELRIFGKSIWFADNVDRLADFEGGEWPKRS